VAGRLLSGAAYGVFTIGLFSYQALHVTEKIRGSAYAITGTGGILPTSTVTPIGEWLVLKGCLAAYLAIGPILCVACFLLGRRIGDEDRAAGNKAGSWGKYSDLLSNRPFVMLAATSTAMALADALAVSVSLLAADRGLVTSYFLASCSVTALIVRLGGAKLLNSLPRAFCLAPCGMLMAGAFMAVSISPSNRAFLICGGIFGIGIGAGFPMMLASVSDVLPPQLRPKGTASALLLYDAGWAVTPLLVGYLTPAMGTGRAFGLLALFAFLALAALFIFYWMPKQGRKLYAR
jgi:MFS family permease